MARQEFREGQTVRIQFDFSTLNKAWGAGDAGIEATVLNPDVVKANGRRYVTGKGYTEIDEHYVLVRFPNPMKRHEVSNDRRIILSIEEWEPLEAQRQAKIASKVAARDAEYADEDLYYRLATREIMDGSPTEVDFDKVVERLHSLFPHAWREGGGYLPRLKAKYGDKA